MKMKRIAIFTALVLCCCVSMAEDGAEGKVYVRSEPAGATIELQKGEKKELIGKAPMLVKLPLGKHTLILSLERYAPSQLDIELKDAAIQKPEAVVLEPLKVNLDIIYEEGWQIAVDKEPQKATTPATISVSMGNHEITLTKEGFKAISKRMEILKNETVEFKDKPEIDASKPKLVTVQTPKPKEQPKESPKEIGDQKLKLALGTLIGNWTIRYGNNIIRHYLVKVDGTVSFKEENFVGNLVMDGDNITLDFDDGKMEKIKISANNKINVEHFNPKSRYPNGEYLSGVGIKDK